MSTKNTNIRLFEAVRAENIEVAESLLLDGADVNAIDENGYTALHWASNLGNVEMVRMILSIFKAPINWANYFHYRVASIISSLVKDSSSVPYLLTMYYSFISAFLLADILVLTGYINNLRNYNPKGNESFLASVILIVVASIHTYLMWKFVSITQKKVNQLTEEFQKKPVVQRIIFDITVVLIIPGLYMLFKFIDAVY